MNSSLIRISLNESQSFKFKKKSRKKSKSKSKIKYIIIFLSSIIIYFLTKNIIKNTISKNKISKNKIPEIKKPELKTLEIKISQTTIQENKSKTKVGLCIICKRENLYIKEFVDHYKNLGYNHIFVYDNGDPGDEGYEKIIKSEIEEGFVSIINFRAYKNNKQIFRAYIDCYEKNNKNYDWLSFFDIDEFLVLKNNTSIQELLDNERYKDCQNIKFNWLLYTDDDKLYYENKPVQERFKTPDYGSIFFNQHIKSNVRGNLSINYWLNATNPHTSENDYIACDSSGRKISKSSPYYFPPDYTYAILKHYRTKSIEEYCNKMKKGKPDDKIDYPIMIEWFFKGNKKTKEKIDYFKKMFNDTDSLNYLNSLKY